MMINSDAQHQHVMLMTAGEIAETAMRHRKWMAHQEGVQRGNGAMATAEFLHKAQLGDEKYVAEADKFLESIEDQVPVSRGWRSVDDVVGAIPNVPAFLAGHPQHMRRRERASKDTAPLTIAMNLSSSMAIRKETILQRGIVLLALVRMLVEHRPVELWVGSGLGDGRHKCLAFWRIDTTPLDLARAAFMIADPAMSRLFGYAMCEAMVDQHLGGFGFHEEDAAAALRRVGGWSDLLYLPAISYYDPMVKDPVGWLKQVMKQYVKQEDE